MFALRVGLVSACVAASWAYPGVAGACGGFFCDNLDPVVQTAERILFRVNADNTVTTIVEIQYEGPPSQFGWVLPISPGLTVEDLGTAPAGLFDALELRTAPVFTRPVAPDEAAGVDDEGSAGCGRGRFGRFGGDDVEPPPPPDTSGVAVVGEAVVGPYALEIITAEQGENLSNWLLLNGYQVPPSAIPAINHYIERKMAFLGVKLEADVPAGPIEALSFTAPGKTPSIPLILTSVAAAQDMEIVAYVAGPGRYVPGNYTDLAFDYESVRWLDETTTDYPAKLGAAVDAAGGKALSTEFADAIVVTGEIEETPLAEVLQPGDYVTRFHTFMSAGDMTADPNWIPGPSAGDVDNHHVVADEADFAGPGRTGAGPDGFAALMVVPVLWTLRRRRRAFDEGRGQTSRKNTTRPTRVSALQVATAGCQGPT